MSLAEMRLVRWTGWLANEVQRQERTSAAIELVFNLRMAAHETGVINTAIRLPAERYIIAK
jgi:hypothetical protein